MGVQERLRIYTVPKVVAEVAPILSAATVIPTQGFWMGEVEDAVILELVSDDATYLDRMTGRVAKAAHDQGEEAILVTREPIDARLIQTDHAWIESIR